MAGTQVVHAYVPAVGPMAAPEILEGSAWTIHFADGTEGHFVYTGSAVEEPRQAWAVQGMAQNHFGRPVFSVTPAGCTGLSPSAHLGRYCPVHA